MKPFFQNALFVLMLVLPLSAFAQFGCRLSGEKEYVELLKRDLDKIHRMEGDFRRALDGQTTTLTNLPVQFHLVRTSTGQSNVTEATLERSITIMNQYFSNFM